jgi:NodT family efflux transporter outer membrane factor (OMF) lipoprotein
VTRARTAVVMLAAALGAGCAGVSSTLPHPPAVQEAWEDPPQVRGKLPADGAWWTSFGDPALDRLVALADQGNLDLRIAGARIREARANRAGAGASLFPQLTGSGGATVERTLAGTPGTPPPPYTLGVSASWEADVFGRLRREADAQEALVLGSTAEAEAVRLTLVAEVVQTYVEYRLAQAQRDIAARNAEAAAETLRIGRLRFEQGLGSRLDVERPTAALAETRAQVASAVERAGSARHRLALLLATTPAALAEILPAAGPLPEMDPVAVLLTPTDVISRRPDVQAAGHAFVAAAARKEAAEALRWPRITLAASVGLDAGSAGSAAFLPWSAIGSLTAGLLAPIFDFGRIRAGIDAADARQEQASLEYERVARAAVNDVQTAVVSYAQGVVRRDELSTAAAAARAAGELARKQYAEGTISLLEVLDAERAQRDNELTWSQATADVSLRAVRLYQAMGIIAPRGPRS